MKYNIKKIKINDIKTGGIYVDELESDVNFSTAAYPRWMIYFDLISVKNIDIKKLYDGYSELFGWNCGVESHSSIANGGAIFSSGTKSSSDLEILIQNSIEALQLENSILKNNTINEIEIVNLSNINGNFAQLQKITFEKAKVIRMTHLIDYVFFKIKFKKIIKELKKYDNSGNVLGSKITSSVSFN